MAGKVDMVEFERHTMMGQEGDEEFLPVHTGLKLKFKFIGNHLEMKSSARIKYKKILFYTGVERRKSKNKHHHEKILRKIIIKIFLQLRLHLLEFKIRIFHHSITGFKKRGRGAGFEPTPHDFCSCALPLY